MPLLKIYPLLAAKAEKKGRSREEAEAVNQWLTGYAPAGLRRLLEAGTSYGDFFQNALRKVLGSRPAPAGGIQTVTLPLDTRPEPW